MRKSQKLIMVLMTIVLLAIAGIILSNKARTKGSVFDAFANESPECKSLSRACKEEIVNTDSAQKSCEKYEEKCLLENSGENGQNLVQGPENDELELEEDELFN